MGKRLSCYLRPQRRRWGFTQEELAFIIDAKSRAAISRLEHGQRQPDLVAAFALHIIFGVTASELFPALFAKVERSVLERAYDLYDQLQGDRSSATRIKLDFLEAVFARAKEKSAPNSHV